MESTALTQRVKLVSLLTVISLAIIAICSFASRKTDGFAPILSFKSSSSSSSSSFELTSTGIDKDNLLDTDYTCLAPTDSTNDDFDAKAAAGVSPPVSWSGAPSGTKSFMITMTSSSTSKDCTRYEWSLYDIDPAINALKADNTGKIGIYGGSWPGDAKYDYAAPCGYGTTPHKPFYFPTHISVYPIMLT